MQGAFSFVQVENAIDMDYVKELIEQTKMRTESGQSYMK
jgi:hypothetical protein